MAHYAYLDLCFFEKCNLTCTYCRVTNEGMVGALEVEHFHQLVRSFLAHSRAAVLKVSGYGEVSLWPGLVPALTAFGDAFPTLQIITNGTMSTDLFTRVSAIENLVFCVTIDGDDPEANAHRSRGSAALHRRILSFAHQVHAAGKGLELNCVLSSANIEQLPDWLRYVRDHLSGAVVMPFPVRPFQGLSESPPPATPTQVARTRDRVLGAFDELASVLPPRAYVERLFEFLSAGRRGHPCYVGAANYGVGPRLRPLACPCLGHTKPSDDLANQLGSVGGGLVDVSGVRAERIDAGRVDERCTTCFTHYEVLNHYLEAAIDTDTLGRLPSFRSPAARAILEQMRRENGRVAWRPAHPEPTEIRA